MNRVRPTLRCARWLAMGAVSALIASTSGCDRPDAVEDVDAALAVDARLSGCDEVYETSGCVPPEDGNLRWWVKAPDDSVATVEADGVVLEATNRKVGEARRFHFQAPSSARSLQLRVTRGHRVHTVRFRLLERRSCAVVDAIHAARKAGDTAQLEALAERVASAPEDPCHASALGQLARASLAAGQRDEAVEGLRASMRAHRRAGCSSCEARDAFALSYALTFEARRFGEAREVLDALEPRLDGAGDAWAQACHYRGIVAFEAGDLREALSWLRSSEARARALGLETDRRASALSLALSLQRLGRTEEAIERLRALRAELPSEATACERAVLHNNLAWASLAAAEGVSGDARREALREVVGGFEVALRSYRDGCNRASQVRNVLVNLAYARQRAGDPVAARDALSQAREAGAEREPRTRPWLSIVEANLALDEGRAQEALPMYRGGLEQAHDALQEAAAWHARLGEGRALEATGRSDDALGAYRSAEAMLDAQVRWIPLVEGLDTFLASREEGARALVDLLLRVNRPEEALQAARAARVRALWSLRWVQQLGALEPARRKTWDLAIATYHRDRAALEEQIAKDWELSGASLAGARASRRAKQRALRERLERTLALLHSDATSPIAPPPLHLGPGEMLWMAHPTNSGWVGFAMDAEGLDVRQISTSSSASSEETADALLSPFEAKLERAQRIRVLAYGPFRHVDMHALPWRGAPLVASKSVAYAADLATSPTADAGTTESAMLLVADPRRDLPSARLEADAVTHAVPKDLRERLVRLEGRQATRTAVVDAMGKCDWLHYAGHGEFAGHGGWESSLPLADGAKLTVGDILALPRAPRLVVLSGCETGRTSRRSPLSQIGLAQAFSIAGSQVVLAATRPVADELALRMSKALYAAWNVGGDPIDAPSRAQRALVESSPEQDWSAFRTFLP
jgi:tetratricopeptide (TPR) repeat protein